MGAMDLALTADSDQAYMMVPDTTTQPTQVLALTGSAAHCVAIAALLRWYYTDDALVVALVLHWYWNYLGTVLV